MVEPPLPPPPGFRWRGALPVPTILDGNSSTPTDPVFAEECSLTPAGRELVADVAPEVVRRRSPPPESFWSDHGLEVVGVGEDRVVAAPTGSECVIKFSRQQPPEQNAAEIANWNAAPPAVREVLAPVVEHGEPAVWLVMPRATEFGTPVDLVRIEGVLEEHGWSCRGLHPQNIGMFNGQPKAFDYGFPCIANGERIRP